jgi:anaerobic carbon-monoxide dehydrogenase iron sulfur subunit
MYQLSSVRDGLLVREGRRVQPGQVAHQDLRVRAWGARHPYTCTQCAEAWCLHACPVEALTRNPLTNAVEVAEQHLRRLQGVHDRLPVRHRELQRGYRKVIKCDLCGGDPACAKACPTGAITYVDANWTGYDRMQASAVAGHGRPA